MSFHVLPLVAAIPFAAPQGEEFKPTASGEVALLVRKVDKVPTQNWWLGETGGLAYFDAHPDGDGIVVVAGLSEAGYHDVYVRLRVTPSGARGEALDMSDVPGPPLLDLAGVAALLTDGKDCSVEFEVSCSEGGWGMTPYFARVHVGEAGLALASALCARDTSAAPEMFHELRKNEVSAHGETFACTGYVDSWGRRQGLWTLSDAKGRKCLETSWKDGRLSGATTEWDENGRRRRLMTFRDGLAEGAVYSWFESGELQSIDGRAAGMHDGLFVCFYPDGRKSSEMKWEAGLIVRGGGRTWDEHGNAVQGESLLEPFTATPKQLQAAKARQRAFLEGLSAFYTRRD